MYRLQSIAEGIKDKWMQSKWMLWQYVSFSLIVPNSVSFQRKAQQVCVLSVSVYKLNWLQNGWDWKGSRKVKIRNFQSVNRVLHGVPTDPFRALWGQCYFQNNIKTICLFPVLILQKQIACAKAVVDKLLVPLHKSRQWPQTAVIATVSSLLCICSENRNKWR